MDRFYRQSWIEINLDNLYLNLQGLKALFPAGVYVMAVIKADAYGHGILPVARFLESKMINYLGVASLDEAIFLRQQGIRSPILVLGQIEPQDIQIAQFYGITITVASREFAEALRRFVVNNSDSNIKVHIKVDTGMRRLGLELREAEQVILQLFMVGLELEGIYTHLSSADSDPAFTLNQINRFEGLVKRLKSRQVDFKLVHISNSAGLVYRRRFEGVCNMIRPGLALYGAYSGDELKSVVKLYPVLSLKSRIASIKTLRKGEGLGYNHSYIADTKRRIAVIPVGYGDGYPRLLSNRGKVLIRESFCPIVGRVCMDYLFVDVTALEGVSKGDEVVLIGKQGINEIGVEYLSACYGSIPYELLCLLGRRLPRIYVSRKYRVSPEEGRMSVQDLMDLPIASRERLGLTVKN